MERPSGERVNTAAEGTKMTEVRAATSADLKWGFRSFSMWADIVETDKVMKCIRPEFNGEIGAMEHGKNGVADSLMRSFTGTIGAGRIGGGGLNRIASVFKEIDNGVTAGKFTTLIEANVLMKNILRASMFSKPLIEIIERGFLGRKALTIKCAGVMISDKTITGFTVETERAEKAITILRTLNHETGVDGEALVAHIGSS